MRQVVSKIRSNMSLAFTALKADYSVILKGTLTIGNGKGRKKTEYRFTWHMGIDVTPTLVGAKYDREIVQQLGLIIQNTIKMMGPESQWVIGQDEDIK